MEKERRKLDRQLNLAQEKTRKANIGQEVLEAKIKVSWSELCETRSVVEGRDFAFTERRAVSTGSFA